MVIFLTTNSVVAFSTRMSDLGQGQCSMIFLLIVSMTSLHESVVMAC